MHAIHFDLFDSPAVVASLAALASHAIFVRRDPSPNAILAIYAFIWLAWPAVEIQQHQLPFHHAILSTVVFTTTYTVVLLTSIGVYRIFFHPLRHVPGPLLLKLSKWSSIPADYRGHRPRLIADLHARYGDVVRVGPREISINDPAAIQPILGAKSKFLKGPLYTAVHSRKGERGLSLFSLVDPVQRRIRRKIWDKAFSVKALASYEPLVHQFTENAMGQIQDRSVQTPSLAADKWCMFFAFDIMGQLGFSKSFKMIDRGAFSDEVHIMEQYLSSTSMIGNVPYLGNLVGMLPNPFSAFERYTGDAVEERLRLANEDKNSAKGVPDLFAHLLGEENEVEYSFHRAELTSEASLFVIAGSDTTSSALSMALYVLSSRPTYLATLREEIARNFVNLDAIDDFQVLAKQSPFLNAVIDETLRFYPPIATGVQRELPADSVPVSFVLRDGVSLDIPSGTVVSMPTRSIHRDPRNFGSDAHQFRPDRWLQKGSALASLRSSFIPFGHGPTGCVGKQLAYMEMRMFLANFVSRFDFSFADHFDEQAFLDGLTDNITMVRQLPLLLKIQKRTDVCQNS